MNIKFPQIWNIFSVMKTLQYTSIYWRLEGNRKHKLVYADIDGRIERSSHPEHMKTLSIDNFNETSKILLGIEMVCCDTQMTKNNFLHLQ